MGVISVAMDRDVRRHPIKFARDLARLPRSAFLSMRALRILAQYHRPGFHPNDRDTKQLIADWRQALFGQDGQLTEVLATNFRAGSGVAPDASSPRAFTSADAMS
jgi:hypothetical protein